MDVILLNIIGTAVTILVTMLLIGLVVFVHELGHFLAARSVGVKVDKFAIGFGPRIWKRQFGDTEFSLRLILLGGFVQMHGDLDASSSRQDEAYKDDPLSYLSKTALQKAWITVAGVLANFVFAGVIFMVFLAATGNTLLLQRIGDYNFIGARQSEQVAFLSPDFREEGAPTGVIRSISGERINSRTDIEAIISNPDIRGELLPIEIFGVEGLRTVDLVLVSSDPGANVASNLDPQVFPLLPEFEAESEAEAIAEAGLRRVLFGEIDADGALAGARLLGAESDSDDDEQEFDYKVLEEQILLRFAGEEIVNGEQFAAVIEDSLGEEVRLDFVNPNIENSNNNGADGLFTSVLINLPEERPEDGGVLGVTFAEIDMGVSDRVVLIEYPSAVLGGPAHAYNSIGYNAYALSLLIGEAIQGRPDALAENVGSVITIGAEVNAIQESSFDVGVGSVIQILNLIGVFSAVLAFMNILPIPILDGGNLVFILVEAIRGKPLPKKWLDRIYLLFFVLLILLSVVVLGLDVVKLFG